MRYINSIVFLYYFQFISTNNAFTLQNQTKVTKDIIRTWIPILQDQMDIWNNITEEIVNSTFTHIGSHVIFQNINQTLYVYDPNSHCFCNRTHVKGLEYDFHLRRCQALASLLNWTIYEYRMKDFEFVWSLDDVPFWYYDFETTVNSTGSIMERNIYPGFGALRCWQKGGFALPFYGSHIKWTVNNFDDFVYIVDTPWHKRMSKAIFRGGKDRGCSFPRDHYINYNLASNFSKLSKDNNCGRYELAKIAKQWPQYIDYNGSESFAPLYEQNSKFKYVLSVEGFGGWADRLMNLFIDSTMLVMNQDHPCDQWFEPILKPFVHFVPFANDFSDLPAKIVWANNNPHMAEQIQAEGTILGNRYFRKNGNIAYIFTLISLYMTKVNYNIVLRNNSLNWKNLFNISFVNEYCKHH